MAVAAPVLTAVVAVQVVVVPPVVMVAGGRGGEAGTFFGRKREIFA